MLESRPETLLQSQQEQLPKVETAEQLSQTDPEKVPENAHLATQTDPVLEPETEKSEASETENDKNLSADLEKYKKLNTKALSKLKSATNQLSDKEKLLVNKESRINELVAKVLDFETSQKDLASENLKQQTENSKLQADKSQLEKDIEFLEQELNEVVESQQKLQAEVDEFQKAEQERDSEAKVAVAGMVDAAEHEKIAEELIFSKSQIMNLQKMVDEKEQTIDFNNTALEELETECYNHQLRIETLSKEIGSLTELVEEKSQEIQLAQANKSAKVRLEDGNSQTEPEVEVEKLDQFTETARRPEKFYATESTQKDWPGPTSHDVNKLKKQHQKQLLRADSF